MIAMATHGRTGVNKLLMGSVMERLLHELSLPLLLVHPQGELRNPSTTVWRASQDPGASGWLGLRRAGAESGAAHRRGHRRRAGADRPRRHSRQMQAWSTPGWCRAGSPPTIWPGASTSIATCIPPQMPGILRVQGQRQAQRRSAQRCDPAHQRRRTGRSDCDGDPWAQRAVAAAAGQRRRADSPSCQTPRSCWCGQRRTALAAPSTHHSN